MGSVRSDGADGADPARLFAHRPLIQYGPADAVAWEGRLGPRAEVLVYK